MTSVKERRETSAVPATTSRETYLTFVLALVLALSILSFVRVRGDGIQNVALWYFAFAFVVTLANRADGLAATFFLLTIGSSLHLQVNALYGTQLKAWAYPGVDACLGFLAASWCRSDRRLMVALPLDRFPSTPLVLLHFWVVISCAVAIARNLWQSGSEFSLRGLTYNTYLVRGVSWQDDYYPLQDLFFISVSLLMLFSVWAFLLKDGLRIWKRLAFAILFGAAANATFGMLQRATRSGWFHDSASLSINAFFPDMHSFAALMAITLLMSFGLLKAGPQSMASRIFIVAIAIAAGSALYRSNSRSILILTLVGFASFSVWGSFSARGWRRGVAILGIVAVVFAIDLILRVGYRGLTYETIRPLLSGQSLQAADATLSLRPEIWRAALRMYEASPFFGLGQGEFYRLSSVPEFSGSKFLTSYGGDNAHNYFLQSFVELGPVGGALTLLCLLPVKRLGLANASAASFYALLGVLIGNLYAHALLIREMLVIAAVLLGMYYWEAEQLDSRSVEPIPGAVRRPLLVLFALAVGLAIIDAARGFQRFPFTFGQRCFEPKSLADDGWASGAFRRALPDSAARVELVLSWERPDVARRLPSINAAIINSDGAVLEQVAIQAQRADQPPQAIVFDVQPAAGWKRTLFVESSNCYVPLNLGVTYDPRRLGVRVRALTFLDAAGAPVPAPQ